jgi:hypothetical protein
MTNMTAVRPFVADPVGETGAYWRDLHAHARFLRCAPQGIDDLPQGVSYSLVPDLEHARRLLGPEHPTQRRARSRVFYRAGSYRQRARLRIGMHDRGEEYVFADGHIVPDDQDGHRRHFPLHVKAIRMGTLSVPAGVVLDASTTPDIWPGLHHREELYTIVRIDRLVMAPGSTLEITGDVALVVLGSVDADAAGGASGRPASLRILGTRHPAFSLARREPARTGADGVCGAPGTDGRGVRLVATPFGLLSDDPAASRDTSGGPGTPGGAGRDGAAGGPGQNGGMAMFADIRIGSLRGFDRGGFRVHAEAGAGQPGADGGRGGSGGRGGRGGDGRPPGPGGAGGPGGRGGAGGTGGSGGLSSNVFLTLPAADLLMLEAVSAPAAGGAGGQGGPGGAGGSGGSGTAPPGEAGPAGRDGRAGKARSGPPIWIFDAEAPGRPPLHLIEHRPDQHEGRDR